MNVFDLAAKLTLDSSGFSGGLEEAGEKASNFGSKLKSGLGKMAKAGAVAITAVTAATTALSSAVLKGTSEVAQYGDNIDKMSQKMGLSATAYQEWDAVMKHSGTSIDTMQAGMKTLANAVENGNKAFERLGMSQEQIASMSNEELFNATITALQGVENETERTYLAGQLLGRGATELGALLNMSAEETQAMKDRVHELGGVMSDEAVKAAAKYQDTLQDMQTAFAGLRRNLFSEFMPGITTVMEGLTDLFTGGGTEKITQGIGQLTDKLTEVIPRVMDVAADIVIKFAEAIVQNLPQLARAAINVIKTLAKAIIDNLPMIVEVALEIILELANDIVKALPELVPAIVNVVIKIVEILTNPDTLSMLVDAAIAIILTLTEEIIKAVPTLIEKIPQIVINIVQAFIKNAPKLLGAGVKLIGMLAKGLVKGLGSITKAVGGIFKAIAEGIGKAVKKAFEWGKDLIKNFINGIKNMFSGIKNVFSSVGKLIKNLIGFSEPKEGVLSNFHTYAPDMMKLYAKGITDNKGLITDAIDDAFNVRPEITRTVNAVGAGQEIIVPRGGASAGGTQTAILEIDRTAFAKIVYKLNNEESGRVGVKVAGVT